ncbi:hypothetical protein [Kitasatospora sp. NPDC092286]|uniref:hypothetical protein n=1 Tax=Kitasatospora sp. NPDC092286 TaxID=3364087 RepID=UPI0038080EB3
MSDIPTPKAKGPSWPGGRRGSRGPTRREGHSPFSPAERLVARFRSLPPGSDDKVRIVAALEDAVADPTVAAFLASVVADPAEDELARVECATVLRLSPPADPAAKREVADALLAAFADRDEDLVRQHVAMAFGPYADDPAVHRALAAALGEHEGDPLVPDNALFAVRQAGPSAQRADLVRTLLHHPELGGEAGRILDDWGVPRT